MKNLTIKYLILVFCALLLPILVNAQQKDAIAFNGLKGNYIYNYFPPASANHPDADGVTGFKLDRKSSEEREWTTLQKFNTPQSFEELNQNFEVAKTKVFDFKEQEAYRVENVWPIFKKDFSYNDIQVYVTQQAMASAFNILLIDDAIRPGIRYEYRVVQLKADGSERDHYLTNAVSSTDAFVTSKPVFRKRKAIGDLFTIEWAAKLSGEMPKAILINRNNGPHQPFSHQPIAYSIEKQGDSIIYSLADDAVRKDMVYQYTITPVNRFGGGAKIVSDTVSLANLDENYLLPQLFTASADSVKKTIALKWGFEKPDFIGAVKVFRSTEYEGTYELIGMGNNYQYYDYTAQPGQKYYYYLTITDRLGRNSVRSVKVYGLHDAKVKPREATMVRAKPTGKHVTISWTDFSKDSRGYYVYKTDQIGGKMVILSDFIYTDTAKHGQYTFMDTIQNQNTAGYSVLVENLSNLRSNLSTPVYISGSIRKASAPILVDLLEAGTQKRIFWRDAPVQINETTGYNVYRKVGAADFVKINRYPVAAGKSSYADTSRIQGETVAYTLKAINAAGAESDFSNQLSLKASELVYNPADLKSFDNAEHSVITLEWQPSQSPVKTYEIFRFIRGMEPVKIAETKSGNFKYEDKGFDKQKTNYYYVVAVNETGNRSVPSNETYVNINQ